MSTKKKKAGGKGGKQFSVNVTAARSDLALLQALIEMHGWREVHIREQKADLIWQFP